MPRRQENNRNQYIYLPVTTRSGRITRPNTLIFSQNQEQEVTSLFTNKSFTNNQKYLTEHSITRKFNKQQ